MRPGRNPSQPIPNPSLIAGRSRVLPGAPALLALWRPTQGAPGAAAAARAPACAQGARASRGVDAPEPNLRAAAAQPLSSFCCEYSSGLQSLCALLCLHTHKKASLACVATTTTTKSTHPHAARGCRTVQHTVSDLGANKRESASGSTDSGSRSASQRSGPPRLSRLTHGSHGTRPRARPGRCRCGMVALWRVGSVPRGLRRCRHWHCQLPARVAVGARGRPTHTQRSCGLAINTHESRSNLSPSARQWRRNPPCTISPPRRRPRPACTPTRCRSRARRACRCASAAAPCTHRP